MRFLAWVEFRLLATQMPLRLRDPHSFPSPIGFLNTVHLADGVDALAGSSPAQWLEDGHNDDGRSLYGVSPHSPQGAAQSDLDSLLVVREGLRALLVNRASGASGPDPTGRPTLLAQANTVFRSVPLVLSLGDETMAATLQQAPGSPGDGRLAAVAAAVIRAHLDGSLTRVKVCARTWCRWAFFDASRNRSRHWCSMASCGNVEKNRAYRARRFTS